MKKLFLFHECIYNVIVIIYQDFHLSYFAAHLAQYCLLSRYRFFLWWHGYYLRYVQFFVILNVMRFYYSFICLKYIYTIHSFVSEVVSLPQNTFHFYSNQPFSGFISYFYSYNFVIYVFENYRHIFSIL